MTRVLLVSDSEWVKNDVKAALTLGEWDLEEVDDSRRASARAGEIKADVVVVDLQVGSMGGMAVIRDIRAATDEETRPRTVLLLDRTADRFLARRALADAAVLKPFTAHELRAALQTLR
jgi:DNA-binding response OmpR family regulator